MSSHSILTKTLQGRVAGYVMSKLNFPNVKNIIFT